MKPKEKAKELIKKFECYVDYQGDDCFNEREKMLINAKQCSLIAAQEIINSRKEHLVQSIKFYEYWTEVKRELERL